MIWFDLVSSTAFGERRDTKKRKTQEGMLLHSASVAEHSPFGRAETGEVCSFLWTDHDPWLIQHKLFLFDKHAIWSDRKKQAVFRHVPFIAASILMEC